MQQLSTLLLLAVATATAASAQTRIYVAEGATGTGTSWQSPTGDLAGAMAGALPNTEIWVAQGTYTPTTCAGAPCTDAERNTSFELRAGVTVIGGFTGVETTAAQADASNVTVLSGDIGAAGDVSDNSYTVVYCSNCGSASGLSKLTVAAGNADRPAGGIGTRGAAGGAVFLDANAPSFVTSPTFSEVTFVDNRARGQGGAMYVNGFGGVASPNFDACVLRDNRSRADGGAIYLLSFGGTVAPAFTRTTFRDNRTLSPAGTTGSGQSGAALYLSAGSSGTADVTLDRCLLVGNTADIASSNQASGNVSGNGGAVYLQSQTFTPDLRLTARNTLFRNNAGFSGGAIYNNRGVVELTNVTVAGNRALGNGGSGAGLYVNGGEATVTNAIFADNEVPNNFSAGRDFRFVDGTITASYTLLQASTRAEAFSRSNPNGNDVYNDGPGMIYGQSPQFVDPAADVPLLSASSPAVDAGLTAAAPGPVDYRGDTRVDNGVVDLGATEFQSPVPVTLVSFAAAAHAEAVAVTWASALEEDLSHYDLLRSRDGVAFATVATLPAIGAGDYAYDDTALEPGATYYYRLRSVDFDGTTYRSEVVAVALGAGAPTPDRTLAARVYPNPTADELHLDYGSASAPTGPTSAALYDLSGRPVATWTLAHGEEVLSLRSVPTGAYVLRVAADTGATALRVTVSR